MAGDRFSQNETNLVRRAASCDDEAFCMLRDRYAQHLRLLVARYAANHDDREDLYAEIVARLLDRDRRALRFWEPIAPFGGYLTTIAIRHCAGWLKRQKRSGQTTLGLLPEGGDDAAGVLGELAAADPRDEPQSVVARREAAQELRDAISQLSDSDQLVLALRFREEMAGPTIARALGISHGAVRQRIFKALRRLRRIVTEGPTEPSGER